MAQRCSRLGCIHAQGCSSFTRAWECGPCSAMGSRRMTSAMMRPVYQTQRAVLSRIGAAKILCVLSFSRACSNPAYTDPDQCTPCRSLRPVVGVCYPRERRFSRGWLLKAPGGSAARTQCRAIQEPAAAASFSSELPKVFDFSQEHAIYCWWEAQGHFGVKPGMEGEPFTITMPPPNVTGALHMGHAMFVTLEDIMIRYRRMHGRPTLYLPGTDHAGIATQLVVEKMLAKEGVKRTDMKREAFVAHVWKWKDEYGGTISNQLRRLGASCDWSREHFTLDTQLSAAVVEAFLRLHQKGLIYRGSYLVNWSPHLQTAVSDLEVEYCAEPGTMYFFKYPVAGSTQEYIPVATTRPETVLGDTALAVNPKDMRYQTFVGRRAVVPMSGGREIPIVQDESVDPDFGTGALKITPGHDANDYAVGKRFKLPIINIMRKDGSLNENAGPYCGMDRFAARERLWSDLESLGLAIKTQPHTLRVPRSQRGGEVVEPLVSKQWFVRMEPLAGPALEAVKTGSLKIIPNRFEKIYNFWLENLRDWCISRQLWWGHRIPAWYVLRPDGAAQAEDEYVVARNEEEAYEKARALHGPDVSLEQDPDVLDTWFSSGLWPFSTLGWPNEAAPDLKRFYPTSVLETGHDILFFWVARMVMMGLEFTGKVPFHTVFLHGLVRDAEGRKMSKTLGNVINPLDIIEEYGTDALRFTLATGTTPGQDVNLSMERLGANKAFTNKLWNAGKFILQNLPDSSNGSQWTVLSGATFDKLESLTELSLPDRWVLSKLHALVDSTSTSFEAYDFGDVGRSLYDFFWSEFADWYIEASKTRLYNNSNANEVLQTRKVLVYTFDRILRLLHPFMPFVTERLWQAMPHQGDALVAASWPLSGLPQDAAASEDFEKLQALVRGVRNARAEYQVPPAKRVAVVVVAGPSVMQSVQAEKATLIALARLDPANFRIVGSAPESTEDAVHLVVAEGLEAYLPQAGLVDVAKELERIGKQAADLELASKGYLKRLSTPSFVKKAPPAVVQSVRDQAADAEERLAILQNRLHQLELLEARGSTVQS